MEKNPSYLNLALQFCFSTSIIYSHLDFHIIHILNSLFNLKDFRLHKNEISYLGGSRVELRATEQGCKH